jgi:signal transduction histidine kinase
MKVKTRIYLLQVVITALMLLMVAVAYVSIQSARYTLQRMQWANQQLEAITTVTVHANRFSEQIAELLLIGEAERSDYFSASRELEAGFTRLERVIREESAFLARRGDRDDSRDELFRVQRMRTLRSEIDRSVAGLVELQRQGRTEESVRIFRNRIENRLDAEFQHLLTAAVLDEQEEVEQAEREAEALWRRLLWIIAVTALVALTIGLVVARQLARALLGPVAQLIAGAEAISRGDLEHRIAYRGGDELGVLAQRFNKMGAQLEQQRALVFHAQSDLERQVAERTGELAIANERLTALDRLRVQFLADISHELRTPLTALRGEAEVTLRHASGSEAAYRDALQRVVGLSHDMGRLVDDLLFLARTETDTLHFALRRTSLREFVAQVGREGSALGRGKAIEVRIDCADPTPSIMADVQRLKQALMIVLDNAVKYSAPGQAVDLRAAEAGRWAEITVRDQGPGISAEDLPHVFDRFYRGLGPTSPGNGLGLAIARWLVEKHRGDITLTSEVGSFTQVRIRIPRIEDEP